MRISDWSSDVCSSDLILLGDIVLARSVCINEAAERNISVADHAAHLIVHGTFHLLGYVHMEDAEAKAMEALKISALRSIGISDPYGDRKGRKTHKWLTKVATPQRKRRTGAKPDDEGRDDHTRFSGWRAHQTL